MDKPPLYFLIEETSRELSSRLLMTHFAIELGYPVVILPQWLMWEKLHVLPRGVVLFKGNSAIQTKNMGVAKRAGHLVASIEEEAFGIADADELSRCYDPGAGSHCDLFLFQGPRNKAAAEKHLCRLEKSAITGNPRADFLRPPLSDQIDAEAKSIREAFGPYLLINTNFAAANARDLDAYSYFEICARAGWVDPDSPDDIEAWFFDAMRYEKACLRSISAYVRGLVSEGFPWNIVIRPHPAEKFDTWSRNFDGLPGTQVLREGDHTAWTKAAGLLVHPSCTTGMEAYLMDTPAACIVPNDATRGRVMVSSLINPTFATVGDLRRFTMNHAAGKLGDDAEPPNYDAVLSEYLTIWPDKLSGQVTVEALADLAEDKGQGLGHMSSSFTLTGGVSEPDPSVDPSLLAPGALSDKLSAIRNRLGFDAAPMPREVAPTMSLFEPVS
jgi:surface carbohydrate biosynthesis protein